MTANIIW